MALIENSLLEFKLSWKNSLKSMGSSELLKYGQHRIITTNEPKRFDFNCFIL